MPYRRLLRPLAVTLSLSAALLVVACGGGDSDGDGDDGGSFAGTTVRSEDGRLTVQVPDGAAPDGVEVEIALIEDDDLPSELRDAEGLGVVGYELSPDGAEFSEPLTVTFSLDPAELGLDLPEGGVPLGWLVTRDAAGEFAGLEGAELSREDGMLVARGTIAHFTPAFLVLKRDQAVALVPDNVDLAVGETVDVTVIAATRGVGLIPLTEVFGVRDWNRIDWTATAPFSVDRNRSGPAQIGATVSCSQPTDDVVVDAFEVRFRGGLATGFEASDIFGDSTVGASLFRLAGDGTCRGAATPGPSSTAAGGSTPTAQSTRTSADSYYELTVSGASGSTEINAGDAFTARGPAPDAAPQLDLVGFDWTWANDSPDLLQLDVHTAGPLGETVGSILIQLSVVGEAPAGGAPGSEPRIGAGLEITDGEVVCSVTDVSRRFRYELNPGEACEVAADGHWHVVLNLSEMPLGDLTVSMVAFPVEGAGAGEDAVTIKGLTRP